MSEHETQAVAEEHEASDQNAYPFGYGPGRMPFFMKVIWVLAIVFFTYYIVTYLLTSLGEDLAAKS